MTAAPVLVRDVAEAKCRKVMASRAGIKLRYDTRMVRADLLDDINALLDECNLLALGR